jgi:hypothetical protein
MKNILPKKGQLAAKRLRRQFMKDCDLLISGSITVMSYYHPLIFGLMNQKLKCSKRSD